MTQADSPAETPRPIKSRLRRWSIRLLFLMLLLFIGGELFARFYLGLGDPPLSQFDPTMEYRFKPDQNCKRFGNHIKYNHYSMRSDDFPIHKSRPDELRVMVIGDSIINGGSLSDQSEIATSILQQKLAEDFNRPVIVGNISAGSWGPPNELAYLKHFGLFDADVLVIVLSSHDYADVPDFKPVVGVNLAWPDHKPLLALWEGFDRYVLPKLKHQDASDEAYMAATAPPRQADIDWSMQSLHDMIAMARASGAKVIVAQHLEKTETMSALLPGHDIIKSACLKDRITPIQFGPPFETARTQGQQLYRDGIHPNAAGQRIIAVALLPAIESSLKNPSSSSPSTHP